MKKNKNCIEVFVKNYRKTLMAHLESGYIDYAQDGYSTLIKIIEDEIALKKHSIEKIQRITLELGIEINQIKPKIGNKIFNQFFKGSSLIRSVLNLKNL